APHVASGSRLAAAPSDRSHLARKPQRLRPRTLKITGLLRSSLQRLSSVRLTVQPFLRRREASESGDCRAKIDRLPFRVKARRLQFVDPREQVIDEAGDALISVRRLRPIKGDQNSRYRNR